MSLSFQEGECSQPPKNPRKQPEVHVSSDAHDCQVWWAHAGTGNIPCHGQRMTEACCLQNNVVCLVAPFFFHRNVSPHGVMTSLQTIIFSRLNQWYMNPSERILSASHLFVYRLELPILQNRPFAVCWKWLPAEHCHHLFGCTKSQCVGSDVTIELLVRRGTCHDLSVSVRLPPPRFS